MPFTRRIRLVQALRPIAAIGLSALRALLRWHVGTPCEQALLSCQGGLRDVCSCCNYALVRWRGGLRMSCFTPGGRANRLQWWMSAVPLEIGSWIFALVAGEMLPEEGTRARVVLALYLAVILLAFWVQTMIGVKRLHDQDKSD